MASFPMFKIAISPKLRDIYTKFCIYIVIRCQLTGVKYNLSQEECYIIYHSMIKGWLSCGHSLYVCIYAFQT